MLLVLCVRGPGFDFRNAPTYITEWWCLAHHNREKPPPATQHPPIHKPNRKVIYKINKNADNSNFFMLMASFRNVTVINLDPANEHCRKLSFFQNPFGNISLVIAKDCPLQACRYDFATNIEDLIKLIDVMNKHSLGLNGGQPTCYFISLFIVALCYYLVA